MKTVLAALAMAVTVTVTAQAEPTRIRSTVSVAVSVANLNAAIEAAGAHVFAIIDFQQGAASVGEKLRPTTRVIFGNPKIGSTALQESQTMGLFVPLTILAWEDADGAVWLMHPDPEDAAIEHGVDPQHPAIQRMKGALSAMIAAAAG